MTAKEDVAEERFRKANENQVVPAESEQKPVNAGEPPWEGEWPTTEEADAYLRLHGIDPDAAAKRVKDGVRERLKNRVVQATKALEAFERAAQPEAKSVDGDAQLQLGIDIALDNAARFAERLRIEGTDLGSLSDDDQERLWLAAEVHRLREASDSLEGKLHAMYSGEIAQLMAEVESAREACQLAYARKHEAEDETVSMQRQLGTAFAERDQLKATATNQAKVNGELAAWVEQLKAEVERLRKGADK